MKRFALFFALLPILLLSCRSTATVEDEPLANTPNIVLIFADDMGYGDLGCYGQEDYQTPHLDKMAAEGVKFTNFYVAQPVCSASRAGLLTGCYPSRVGVHGAYFPNDSTGLNPKEVTIAELCKAKDYATAVYGKWHLGHLPDFLPNNQGFDEYFGIPYSNDMWPKHPNNANFQFPELPVLENGEVVEYLTDNQDMLTTRFTERAVRFIEQNRERPFFLYVAHSMPHVPLFVSDKFRGKSGAGLYGDVIQEIDWSVGQILGALQKNGLDENTLVVFTSDNGPWLSYGNHAGVTAGLREGKGTVWEGGIRVPCIMRWPGKVPAGSVQEKPAATIDILPTVAHWLYAPLPSNKIDGKNIAPLVVMEEGAENPHDAYYFYYRNNEFQSVLSGDGRWKLYFPHTFRSLEGREGGKDGQPVPYNFNVPVGLELYDLENDPFETTDVMAKHPEVVSRLKALADENRSKLGDNLQGVKGAEVRKVGDLRKSGSAK